MKTKIFLFFCLIPLAASQTEQEVLDSIPVLFDQVKNFQFPTNYNEYAVRDMSSKGTKYGKGEYDIIIIGAGSGGTILANRLSEVSFWKVLLLETGQNETLYTDIPQLAPYLQFSHKNWAYQSVPETTCCQGMVDKKCNVPRGKVMGGSSGINFMMYIRGNKQDYNNMCVGNPGWCYKDILPYFKQVEHSTLTGNVDPAYHGKNGTLNVEFVRNFGKLGQAFIDANVELDLPVLDYNGKNQMGVSRMQDTTVNGRRCSGNKAFVTPVLNRKNLEVVTEAFVTKINMENKNGLKPKARTVEFFKGGEKYYVRGKVEIIVSAGAIGTPQILLHSGIGPKKDLEKLGIPVVKDLQVGANLHDHSMIITPFLNNYIDPTFTSMDVMVRNYLHGFGYLTSAANLQSISFINTTDPKSSVPELEQIISPFFDLRGEPWKKILNLENDVYDDLFAGYGNSSGIYIQVLLHPKSRGSVKLKSNNVLDLPLIDMGYYSNPDDFRPMVKGLKNLMKVSETDAMKKFNVSIRHNALRVCSKFDYGTDKYWICHLQHLTSTLFHLGGTCKMGPDSDPTAVLNYELKVKGIDNLRVIDASMLPDPISGHNNGPVMAIGAKAADLIKLERLGIPPSVHT